MLEVVGHTGYHSVSGRSEFIKLPVQPAELAILHPADNAHLKANHPVHLWGSFAGVKSKKEPAWYVDGKKVGEGLDIWLPALDAGEHNLELRLRRANTASVKIYVEE